MSRDFSEVNRETAWLPEDHLGRATSAAFRKRFAGEFEDLFVRNLMMGLLKPGTISLDGTRIQANASGHRALGREYANRPGAQLQAGFDVPAELKRHEVRPSETGAAVREAREEQTGRRSGGEHTKRTGDPGTRMTSHATIVRQGEHANVAPPVPTGSQTRSA